MEKKGSGSSQGNGEGKKGRRARHNALEPELRLINVNTKEEVDTDTLTVSRYETLSASDYHLGVLPPVRIPAAMAQKGYLGTLGSGMTTVGSSLYTGVETVGQGMWDATMYGPRIGSSVAQRVSEVARLVLNVEARGRGTTLPAGFRDSAQPTAITTVGRKWRLHMA